MIKYVLMMNKQGQTRLSRYYGVHLSTRDRITLESEVVRKCLSRSENQCSFLEFRDHKIVYRRYASLFVVVGVDTTEVFLFLKDFNSLSTILQNDLAVLEFIQFLIEVYNTLFENVCELDIMYHLDTAHFVLDEIVVNGHIVETNPANVIGIVNQLTQSE
ncbi:clathrin adaptor complex small chain family protein [Pelomyxa schiedti]|nr:clathrin adaptor complex small chain family protein [Pelomyxa schiedti]